MNVYWVGGEDISFGKGANPGQTFTTSPDGRYRSNYSRGYTNSNAVNGVAQSNPFPGGALTTCWLSTWLCSRITDVTDFHCFGLGSSAFTDGRGLWVSAGSTLGAAAISKFDGTTLTHLAQSSINVFNFDPAFQRFDLQVVNYGASATVTLYLNGSAIVTYTGNVTVSGVSSLDVVMVSNPPTNVSQFGVSEVLVADSDTRGIQGVMTMALSGNGTTNSWTNNTYTNINAVSYSDASPAYVNATGQNQQYDITNPYPAVYTVAAVMQTARMAQGSGSTPTAVKLGYNSGGTVAFGSGASKTLTTAYASYDQLDAINPVTGVAFVQSEMNALQLDMQSA